MKLLVTAILTVLYAAPLSALAQQSAQISPQLPNRYTVSYEFAKKPSVERGSITLSSDGEAIVAIQKTPSGETRQLFVNGKTYYSFTLQPSGTKRAEVHKGPAVGLLDKLPLLATNLLGVDGIIEATATSLARSSAVEYRAKALVLTRRAVDGTPPFHAGVTTRCLVNNGRPELDAVQQFNAGGMESSAWDGKLFQEVRYSDYRPIGEASTPHKITCTLFRSGGANIESETITTTWILKKESRSPLPSEFFNPEKFVAKGSVVQDGTLGKTVAFENVESGGSLDEQASVQRSREEGKVEDAKGGLPPTAIGAIVVGAVFVSILIWRGSRRGQIRSSD